jgi:hypothetical protein
VIIEYRDIRPSGAVISSWTCPGEREFGNDYSQFGPGMEPQPPWERQRREPGGEWVAVLRVHEDGSTEMQRPDGSVLIVREWWE